MQQIKMMKHNTINQGRPLCQQYRKIIKKWIISVLLLKMLFNITEVIVIT